MYAPNRNLYGDLWGKKTEERIKVSRHKKYKCYVNAIDVAQNIKQSGHLTFIYSF
jgi:hypothetical protein